MLRRDLKIGEIGGDWELQYVSKLSSDNREKKMFILRTGLHQGAHEPLQFCLPSPSGINTLKGFLEKIVVNTKDLRDIYDFIDTHGS